MSSFPITEAGTQAVTPEGVGRRYVKAALHTGFGGVASRFLTGLAPIILARYLGPKEYGIYALVLALVSVVAGASHLGQNNALQKFLPEYSVKDRRRGGAILADTLVLVSLILLVVCSVFFLASRWIATAIYHEPSLTDVFRFSALLVLFLSLFNLALSAVAGLQDFKAYSKAMVVRSAGFLALAWVGVWLFGLYGALGGQLLACVLGVALLMGVTVRGARQRFPGMVKTVFSRDILGELFSFSFPAFLAGILVAPAYWWANTLLARDKGFVQVGLFGVAFALCQVIQVLPSSLSIPAVSFMSESHASAAEGNFSALVGTNLRLVWALTLPIALGCALFAPWIVRLLFGAAYRDAAPLAFTMSLVGLLMAINSVIGNAIAASGRMWHGFGINLVWLLIFLGGSFALIPKWGATGLAVCFASSYLVLTATVWYYTRNFLEIRYERANILICISLSVVGIGFLTSFSAPGVLRFALNSLVLFVLLLIEIKWLLNGAEKSFIWSVLTWK